MPHQIESRVGSETNEVETVVEEALEAVGGTFNKIVQKVEGAAVELYNPLNGCFPDMSRLSHSTTPPSERNSNFCGR